MEKEGLAVVEACKVFRPYLMGQQFMIVMDHRALKFLAGKDPSTGRLARWFDTLHDKDFTIRYRPGSAHGNADALSRQAWPDDKDTPWKEGEVLGRLTPNTQLDGGGRATPQMCSS